MSKTIKIDTPATIKFVSNNANNKRRRAIGIGSTGVKKPNNPNGRPQYKFGGKSNVK